jgi:hypothetical protein
MLNFARWVDGLHMGFPGVVGCEEMRRPGEVARRSAHGLREVPEGGDQVLGNKRLLEESGVV